MHYSIWKARWINPKTSAWLIKWYSTASDTVTMFCIEVYYGQITFLASNALLWLIDWKIQVPFIQLCIFMSCLLKKKKKI